MEGEHGNARRSLSINDLEELQSERKNSFGSSASSTDSVSTAQSSQLSRSDRYSHRRASSSNMEGSFLGSISQRFQSKSNRPPRHALLRTSGRRDRRRPIVLSYDSTVDRAKLSCQPTDEDDTNTSAMPFDVEAAVGGHNLDQSQVSSPASSTSSTRSYLESSKGPTQDSARRLSSSILGRASISHAQQQSQKYDVHWKNDRDCAQCQLCFAPFTKLSRRKHHCRVCGELICGDCSVDQVRIIPKFEAPKRACSACVTMLLALRFAGDARVQFDMTPTTTTDVTESSAVEAPTPRRSFRESVRLHRRRPKAQPDDVPSTPNNSGLVTPRYHDRTAELRRVTQAGRKSKRRGHAQRDMYVINAEWLRQWLAFSSESDPYDNSFKEHTAPGPIDNLLLIELVRGRLQKHPSMVRDVQPQEGGSEGDYQLVAKEVWEVLVKMYGGGPVIRVAGSNQEEWVVDVDSMLMPIATKVEITPFVHNALRKRHQEQVAPASDADSISNVELRSQATPTTTRNLWKEPEGSDRLTMNDLESQKSPQPVGRPEPEPEMEQWDKESNTSSNENSASAASAFALAMKQARMNAQKALDDHSRQSQYL